MRYIIHIALAAISFANACLLFGQETITRKVEIVGKRGESQSILIQGAKIASLLQGQYVPPDTWAISSSGQWGAFPINERTDGPLKNAVYYKLSHILIASVLDKFVVTEDALKQFKGSHPIPWFELEKIYGVNDDGRSILASMRYRDSPVRIRSVLVLFDLSKKTYFSGSQIDQAVFGLLRN